MPQPISFKTKIALAVTITLWSSAFVGIRISLNGYSPGALALFRFLIASVCMAILYFRMPNRHIMQKSEIGKMLAVGMIGLGVYHVALNYGEQTVTSGIASFIISQSPIVTAAFAILVLRESISFAGLVGMLISFLGVIIIFMGGGTHMNFGWGALSILCATIAGSIYAVLQKPFLRKYHAIEATTFAIWGGTLSMLIFMPQLAHDIVNASWVATGAIIYLGIFPAAIAYLGWSYVLAEMPAARAANFMYFMPFVATLLGWLILGETPKIATLLGGLTALAGVWLLNKSYT